MSNRAQLERYIPMVTFISEICGKNYEVILHDVSDFFAISQHLHGLMRAFSLPGEDSRNSYTEDLDDSIPGLSTTLIHNTVLNFGVPPSRMTPQEKEQVIQALEHQGVFSTKGSVGQAAKELNISEPTVYRYLRRIRTRGDSDV